MKSEAVLKFRLPKEKFIFEIHCQAEPMHEALVELNKFLFNGNRDLTLEDVQGFFKDLTAGLIL